MDVTSFFPIISGAIGGATTSGVFKEPIEILNRFWYNKFGHKSELTKMIKEGKNIIISEQVLNEFQKEIGVEIGTHIDSDNIQSPKTSIVGPAINDSEFYLEEKELRTMFAKLIASSMDKSKEDVVHNSFSSIIKELSGYDAAFLSKLSPDNSPILQIIVRGDHPEPLEISPNHFKRLDYNGPIITLFETFFYSKDFPDYHKNAFSIVNLRRLGIIEISSDRDLNKKKYTEVYTGISYYKKKNFRSFNDLCGKYNMPLHYEIVEQQITLTEYGKSFYTSCIL